MSAPGPRHGGPAPPSTLTAGGQPWRSGPPGPGQGFCVWGSSPEWPPHPTLMVGRPHWLWVASSTLPLTLVDALVPRSHQPCRAQLRQEGGGLPLGSWLQGPSGRLPPPRAGLVPGRWTHPPEGHACPQPPHQLTRSPLPPALPHPFPRGLRGRARSLGGRGRRACARQPASRPGGAQRPFRWPCTCLASWSQGTGRQGPWVPRRWQVLAQCACLLGGDRHTPQNRCQPRSGAWGSPRTLAPTGSQRCRPRALPLQLAPSLPPALQPAPTSQGRLALAAGG